MRARPDLPETILNRVAAEILASQSGSTGEAAGKAIRDEIVRRLRIEPAVKQAMAEAFAVVLEEFRHTTLNDSRVLETVGRQVHGVTGGQMREFAQRLRAAIPRPLTEEQILSWADEHQDRTGEWPTAWSGPVARGTGRDLDCNPRSFEPWIARASGWFLIGPTARQTSRQAKPEGSTTAHGRAGACVGRRTPRTDWTVAQQ